MLASGLNDAHHLSSGLHQVDQQCHILVVQLGLDVIGKDQSTALGLLIDFCRPHLPAGAVTPGLELLALFCK